MIPRTASLNFNKNDNRLLRLKEESAWFTLPFDVIGQFINQLFQRTCHLTE